MSPSPVTFIYTNSFDTTTDLIISHLGTENVFRFNFDLWRNYQVTINAHGFLIANPTGRSVSRNDIAKAYWRKPMRKQHMFPDINVPRDENYLEEELWYALREVLNILRYDNKLVLIEPFGDIKAGKIIQSLAAKKYFNVPDFRFICGPQGKVPSGPPMVAKSLTSRRVRQGAVLYTTKITPEDLDPKTPWMLQELVDAEKDITIVFVRNQLFSFELSREWFLQNTVDWREVSLDPASNHWPAHPLPAEIANGIFKLMNDLGLQYGRIDMLLANGQYYFLEVNSSGEWGWLDIDGEYGLLEKMLGELSPATPIYPLPSDRKVRI